MAFIHRKTVDLFNENYVTAQRHATSNGEEVNNSVANEVSLRPATQRQKRCIYFASRELGVQFTGIWDTNLSAEALFPLVGVLHKESDSTNQEKGEAMAFLKDSGVTYEVVDSAKVPLEFTQARRVSRPASKRQRRCCYFASLNMGIRFTGIWGADLTADDLYPAVSVLRKKSAATYEEKVDALSYLKDLGITYESIEAYRVPSEPVHLELKYTEPDYMASVHKTLPNNSLNNTEDTSNRIQEIVSGVVDTNFIWPTTDAPLGNKRLAETDWPKCGLLKHMGYVVGQKGRSSSQRQQLLCYIFENELPNVVSSTYMGQWGERKTATRLKKIACSIAAFTRNAKRGSKDRKAAITDWEEDLEFLYNEYYVGTYYFSWPTTGNIEYSKAV